MPLSPARDVGVQSYCFRYFKDNVQVSQLAREIGLEKIELCGVHANFDDPDAFAKVLAIYKAAGISVCSIGVQTFTGDEPRERAWFQCAKLAGAKVITAHFTVSTFTQAVPIARELCEEFDVSLALHCHGGAMFGGSPDVLSHLLKLGGPRFGLCLDTAWCLQAGPYAGGPLQWIRKTFAGRIASMHYKDFTFDPKGNFTDVVLGDGALNLPQTIVALEETGFTGPAVLEYEGDEQNPGPALAMCAQRLREAS